MKYFDITLTISPQMAVWPGDPKVSLGRASKIEEGANANVSRMDMGVHTGTHVDAPYHFLQDGTTVETLPLEVLIGPVQVVELPDEVAVVDAAVLEKVHFSEGITKILFKTRNSKFWSEIEPIFHTEFVGILPDAARILVDRGFQLVGMDYLSVAPYKKSRPTHEVFLRAKVILVEGVNLAEVPAGIYQLICLPMKLGGSDGAPARIVLVQD